MEHLIPSFIHIMLNNKNERINVWELIVEKVIAVANGIHYHIFLTNNWILVNCNHIELNIKELEREIERYLESNKERDGKKSGTRPTCLTSNLL